MESAKEKIELKIPAKATVWYIASGAIARLIGALMTPVFTRLLTPLEYGLYPLYTSWLGIFSVLVTLEVTGAAIYRGFQKYEGIKDDFISAALGLIGAVFVGFCALYFALYPIIARFMGLDAKIIVLLFLEIFANSVLSLYLAKARFEYKYKTVALINLANAILIPLTAIGYILILNVKAEARIYASVIASLTVAIPIIITILRRSEKLYSKEIWLYLLGRSIPLLPHYFAASMILKSSEISIGRTHGTDALGQYSVAMSIGMLMTIVTGGLISALGPWITRKIKENSIGKIRDFLFLTTKALAVITLGVLAIAPELLSILASESFRDALPSIYPLEIAVILSFLSGAIMSGCTYFGKGVSTSLPALISAAISVLVAVIILPRVDYRFAGIFALVSYLILAIATSLVFKRLSGEYPIHLKRTANILALTIAYASLMFIFRSVILSRFFLALPLIPLFALTAKDILKAVRE